MTKIREALQKRGISLAEAAKRINRAYSQVCPLTSGKLRASANEVNLLCALLGESPEILFDSNRFAV